MVSLLRTFVLVTGSELLACPISIAWVLTVELLFKAAIYPLPSGYYSNISAVASVALVLSFHFDCVRGAYIVIRRPRK